MKLKFNARKTRVQAEQRRRAQLATNCEDNITIPGPGGKELHDAFLSPESQEKFSRLPKDGLAYAVMQV